MYTKYNISPNLIIYKALREHVFSVCSDSVDALLDAGEVHEVTGSVHLVVELLGVGERQLVSHVRVVSDSHEVVVPGALKYQIETKSRRASNCLT